MGEANAISDIERAEHLAYADSKGVKRVSVFNDGVQINAATEEKQDAMIAELQKGEAVFIRESGDYVYIANAPIGSATSSAAWKIQRLDTSTLLEIKWADGNANYDNIADDYLTLTYL